MHKINLFFLSVILLAACTRVENKQVVTWVPVYISASEYSQISSQPSTAIINGGKIVLNNNKLYMVEQGQGIHVVNYTNPAQPEKERFIKVPGCYEVSLKNGYLIVNNGPDLVSLNISDPDSVVVAYRLANVFKSLQEANSVPPNAVSGDYFECVDISKGIISKWIQKLTDQPKCKLP
jgi:hypothetical protein